jgi:DNA-binding response OmpR family regulator
LRILLVEDDRKLSRILKRGLEEEGYAVDVADDGEVGGVKAETTNYDSIILDLMLPKQDGFSLIQRWRAAGMPSHILVLSARGRVEDKIKALDLGADDYLTKPFELRELLARLRALVRRRHEVKSTVMKVYDLEIDSVTRRVHRAGKEIRLTPREYRLLEFLAYNRGRVVSRTMIWEHLYDENDESTSNVIDVYIRYLRNKLDRGYDPQLILTRWGEGYMLRACESNGNGHAG